MPHPTPERTHEQDSIELAKELVRLTKGRTAMMSAAIDQFQATRPGTVERADAASYLIGVAGVAERVAGARLDRAVKQFVIDPDLRRLAEADAGESPDGPVGAGDSSSLGEPASIRPDAYMPGSILNGLGGKLRHG